MKKQPEAVVIQMDAMHRSIAALADSPQARSQIMNYAHEHGRSGVEIIQRLIKMHGRYDWRISDIACICVALRLSPKLVFEDGPPMEDSELLPKMLPDARPLPPKAKEPPKRPIRPYTSPRPAVHNLTREEVIGLTDDEPLTSFFISRFALFEWEEFFDQRTDDELRGAYQEWLDLQAAKEAAK